MSGNQEEAPGLQGPSLVIMHLENPQGPHSSLLGHLHPCAPPEPPGRLSAVKQCRADAVAEAPLRDAYNQLQICLLTPPTPDPRGRSHTSFSRCVPGKQTYLH